MKTCFLETSHFLPYEFHSLKNVGCWSFSLPEAFKGMILTMPCFSYILLLFLTWKYLIVGLIISFRRVNQHLDTMLQYFPTEKSSIFQSISVTRDAIQVVCCEWMMVLLQRGAIYTTESMDSYFYNNSFPAGSESLVLTKLIYYENFPVDGNKVFYRRDAFFLICTGKGMILFTKVRPPGGRKYLEKKDLGFNFRSVQVV